MITQLDMFAVPVAPPAAVSRDELRRRWAEGRCEVCGVPIMDNDWLAFGADDRTCEPCHTERQRTWVSLRAGRNI